MTRARILADYVSSGDELLLKAPLISPALVTPNLGTPSAGVMTNMTGAVTASLVDDAVTGAKIENNPTIAGNLTVSGDLVPSTPLSHRNMIINGAMNVAQRNTSNLNTGGEGYTTVDRFRWTSGDYTDNFDFTQASITGVAGITKAWKVVNDVDEGSVPDAHIVGVQYKVEAQDFIRVLEADGTGTVPFTLSFYAKVSTGTGTYSVYLDLPDTSSSANSRYTSSSTVSDANWNRYEINIPANSAGIVTNNNGNGLDINWILVAGADFTGGTTGAWAVSSSNNNKKVSGQTQLWSGATGRSFELTGVQLELGSNTTPFEHRSYGDELEACKRYYQEVKNCQTTARENTSTRYRINHSYVKEMRDVPALARTSNNLSFNASGSSKSSSDTTQAQGATISNNCFIQDFGGFSDLVDGGTHGSDANVAWTMNAEL